MKDLMLLVESQAGVVRLTSGFCWFPSWNC